MGCVLEYDKKTGQPKNGRMRRLAKKYGKGDFNAVNRAAVAAFNSKQRLPSKKHLAQ